MGREISGWKKLEHTSFWLPKACLMWRTVWIFCVYLCVFVCVNVEHKYPCVFSHFILILGIGADGGNYWREEYLFTVFISENVGMCLLTPLGFSPEYSGLDWCNTWYFVLCMFLRNSLCNFLSFFVCLDFYCFKEHNLYDQGEDCSTHPKCYPDLYRGWKGEKLFYLCLVT